MPSFEHLTIQDRDVKANILAIGSANNAVPGQWYLATNTNEYFFGAQDGSLIGPLVPQNGQFIQSIADTDGIDLDVTTNELTAALQLDAASDNLLSLSAAGLYAKEYTIHPDSQPYLEIDGNNQIKTKQLLITDTTVDTTETSIGDHITASGYAAGNLIYEEGDIIILTQVQETWIHNGGTVGDATDFTEISADVTDSYIRNLFTATDGVAYNPSTGVFNLDVPYARQIISGTAPINYDDTTGVISLNDNGITNAKFRQSAANSVVGRAAGSLGNVADISAGADDEFLVRRSGTLEFDTLQAGDIENVGAITGATNGLTKSGSDVKLGGALTEDTALTGDYFFHLPSKIGYLGVGYHKAVTVVNTTGTSTDNIGKYFLKTGIPNSNSNRVTFIIKFFYNAQNNTTANDGEIEVFYTFRAQGDIPINNVIQYHSKISGDIRDSVGFLPVEDDGSGEIQIPVLIREKIGSLTYLVEVTLIQQQNKKLDLDFVRDGDAQVSAINTSISLPEKTIVGAVQRDVLPNTDYGFEVIGDTRITSGLWVGGGSPPANLPNGVVNANTGYRVSDAAAAGQYLRGNGTNFIGSALLASDINGIVDIDQGGTGLNALGTPGQILKVNTAGDALEYVDEAAADPYTFENALTKDGSDVVRLGGDLTQNTTIGMQGFNLHFTRTTGKITFFSATPGPSDFNVHDKDVEIISANPGTTQRGLILQRSDGTRVKAIVGPNNQWDITPI